MAADDAWWYWWSEQKLPPSEPCHPTGSAPDHEIRVADRVRAALSAGLLTPPLPGHGHTADRLTILAAWGRADPVFARLAEGHADAVAILAELNGPSAGDQVWGVWAAVPQSITAKRRGGQWILSGVRPWCSGAGVCQRALLTARAEDGIRLFAIDVADGEPIEDSWPAVGMAASDSRAVRLDSVVGVPVGGVGQYVARPGFWHGGVGVAACWYGGAQGVADALLDAARSRDLNPHALAHLGGIDVALHCGAGLLHDAAEQIDADPAADRHRLAVQVRLGVEAIATQVLDRVGRALGAGPLCQDNAHARRVADLTVYLRQSHAEADLAELGALVRAASGSAW
jgi:alkylation response protein AidB-like acyl-CoA dehydrogenase